MNHFCLTILKFLLPAWVGAATLFVATSVAEQIHPGFPAETKDTLAAIRFPIYYAAGFVVLVIASLLGSMMLITSDHPTTRRKLLAGLVILTLLLMISDYVLIFDPLYEMMISAQPDRSSRFTSLHQASKLINLIELIILMAAAVITVTDR